MSKRLRLIQVEAGERSVELFAEILLEAGAVALNEAIFGAVPLSQDVDGVVELRRPDSAQEAGLQEVVDQLLADLSAADKPLVVMRPLGSRCFDMARHGLSPVPGQKLIQPMDSMIIWPILSDGRRLLGDKTDISLSVRFCCDLTQLRHQQPHFAATQDAVLW
jgi:hypothetical protein